MAARVLRYMHSSRCHILVTLFRSQRLRRNKLAKERCLLRFLKPARLARSTIACKAAAARDKTAHAQAAAAVDDMPPCGDIASAFPLLDEVCEPPEPVLIPRPLCDGAHEELNGPGPAVLGQARHLLACRHVQAQVTTQLALAGSCTDVDLVA